jgi:hypothetical protein
MAVCGARKGGRLLTITLEPEGGGLLMMAREPPPAARSCPVLTGGGRGVFVPQSHAPARTAEVDSVGLLVRQQSDAISTDD